jgi:hypothetical protein
MGKADRGVGLIVCELRLLTGTRVGEHRIGDLGGCLAV